MKRNLSQKLIAIFLALGMLLSLAPTVLAADEPLAASEEISDEAASAETDATGDDTPNKDLIEWANGIANLPHALHTDSSRKSLTIKNKTMSLEYGIIGNSDQMYVQSLSNTKGNAYVTNTMDVFLDMNDGNRYYASGSLDSAKLNIYRYGYYYYENRIEGQTFISGLNPTEEYPINILTKPSDVHDIENLTYDNGVFSYNTTPTGSDPFFGYYINDNNVTADNYDFVEITVKVTGGSTSAQLFLIAGDYEKYTSDQSTSFTINNDGEYHTYQLPLTKIAGFKDRIKGVRFDINGQVEVSSIRLFKAEYTGIDASLSIQRSFLTYSDKLHHLTQFSTIKTIENVAAVGMETKIDADTVSMLVVKDKNGRKNTLEGVDWESAEYIGFDITGAGIFGYILPCDGKSGSMTVTLENGIYTITQTLPIASGQFVPSEEKTANGNDVFFGQRLYNDETHDFAAFIDEAEAERNPLTQANFAVDVNECGAAFVGYEPLYGYYRFAIDGIGFNGAYFETPNRQFNLRFTVKGDEYNRKPYFMTRATNTGGLECAALLDERNMLLPIPMEVAKNFSGDGEANVYNLDDPLYSETFFPMIVNAGETRTYNLLNLYQNWGRFPLKQISSIQFHTPYYHFSTGVTETNCINLLTQTGPGLPDFRSMSAPFWATQPQHNSGGGHSFLRYTDADGKYAGSQNTTASIDSYGPTYCDITLGFDSDDGRISATYTHAEMPQTDENRTYYTLKYTFNDTVSFDDFAHDFIFYKVSDNNATGTYKKVGYLDESNTSQVKDAVGSGEQAAEYVLGNECPYFSFFMMPDWNRESKSAEGYTNLAMLFKDWKVTQNNVVSSPDLLLINTYAYLTLSMDLGEITFNKGDSIEINAILMPWGSQEMEDDPANRLAANTQAANPDNKEDFYLESADHVADYTATCSRYSDVLPDGTLYMDKNVRDVRINTLLNPLYATAVENCTVLDSPFVPKLKTADGKSATFTLKGGENNNTVRIYGFDKLTVPYIEEYVNGEWIEYKVDSASAPDKGGYGYDYDGYMVHYDADGTYSYSFVAEMDYTDADGRTFRITAEKDFEGWEVNFNDTKAPVMNRYFDAELIHSKASTSSHFSKSELNEENGEKYVSLYGNGTSGEAYMGLFANSNYTPSGRYIVYKYRIPKTNTTSVNEIQFWTSTVNGTATESTPYDYITVAGGAVQADGEWHVLVIDVSQRKQENATFSPTDDGVYCARYLRVDFWNSATNGPKFDTNSYVDVAYVGFSDSLAEIAAVNSDMKKISVLKTNSSCLEYSPAEIVPDNNSTLTVESVGAHAGEEFTISINVNDNTGLSYLKLIPRYDEEIFTLKSVKNGKILSGLSTLDGHLSWTSVENATDDGSLVDLTFVINENAPKGNYTIELDVVDGNGKSGEDFSATVVNAAANVIVGKYGDCSGDNVISILDITALRKYLANYDYDTGVSTSSVEDGADVNGDGYINTLDITALRKYFANYNYDTGESSEPLGRKE